jgi:hypothetical protein
MEQPKSAIQCSLTSLKPSQRYREALGTGSDGSSSLFAVEVGLANGSAKNELCTT